MTQYKTFHETYKIISFAMTIGMLYPNKAVEKRRLFFIFALFLSVMPLSIIIILDMYKSWLLRDIINIIRHGTVFGPFLAIFLKILILFYKRNEARQLIDEIDRDYVLYNDLTPSYQTIVNSYIQNNFTYSEKCWTIMVSISVLVFPGVSIVLNIYNFAFKDEPIKYMVHDVNKPFSPPEDRMESPFFEIVFVYTCYCALFYIVNFTGFDGFFALIINHACLKIDLFCKAFEDAMKARDEAEIHKKMVVVIKEQIRMFEYAELIKETFHLWLGLILVASMIQICNCMYHITESAELDPRYIFFIMAVAVQIYLPCRYSSKLKDMSIESSTRLYCGGWEHVYDTRTRRTMLIMMARGLIPIEITAFKLMLYDMELFVSILKTSYSMYTLLRS